MKRRILILFLMMLFFPFAVKADTISLKCPSEYEVNVEFSCDVYGNSIDGIYDISSYISLVNLKYVTFEVEGNLNGGARFDESTGKYRLGLYGMDLLKGEFKIGVIKLIGSSSTTGKISLVETSFSNKDGKIISVANVTNTLTLKQQKVVEKETTKGDKQEQIIYPHDNSSTTKKEQSKNTVTPKKEEQEETNKEEEETEEEYKIDFSKGAYLLDLRIDGYDIDFRSDVFQYKLKIGNEKKLKISPTVSSKDITYKVIDNENLKDGSIITIEVIYKNQQMKYYYIDIEKNKKTNILKYALIGIIVLLILINAIRFLVVRRGNNETESE